MAKASAAETPTWSSGDRHRAKTSVTLSSLALRFFVVIFIYVIRLLKLRAATLEYFEQQVARLGEQRPILFVVARDLGENCDGERASLEGELLVLDGSLHPSPLEFRRSAKRLSGRKSVVRFS